MGIRTSAGFCSFRPARQRRERGDQRIQINRLEEVTRKAARGVELFVTLPAHRKHRRVGRGCPRRTELAQERPAILTGHPQVDYRGIDRVGFEHGERSFRAARACDLSAAQGEVLLKHINGVVMVVDDEDREAMKLSLIHI